jgi:plastocyanin
MCADRWIPGGRRACLPCLVAAVLSLVACGGSSVSPTAGGVSSSAPERSTRPAIPAPGSPSAASATPATNRHCAITPEATAAATVKWNAEVQGRDPTIKAGEAVAFVTSGNERPTVTEGMKGTAVANPCIDKVLSANSPVVVTFSKPGVYNLFCRKEPTLMFTAVHVQ